MSAEWAPTWSYQWFADIGVPAIVGGLGAVGTIAVGVGAILVAASSNKLASTIAERDHNLRVAEIAADELNERAAFGRLVIQWSDRVIEEIKRPAAVQFASMHDYSAPRSPSEDLKADVDARAAAFADENGRELVRGILWLTSQAPGGVLPSDNDQRELIDDVRRLCVQSWVATPATWTDVAASDAPDIAARSLALKVAEHSAAGPMSLSA